MKIDAFDSPVVITDYVRDLCRSIELYNEKIYDITLGPDVATQRMAQLISFDLKAIGIGVDVEDCECKIKGIGLDDSILSRTIRLRFSRNRQFPWSLDVLTDIHLALMANTGRHNAGRIRNCTYHGPQEDISHDLLPVDVGPALHKIITILNVGPYNPIVASTLAWNLLEMTQPFDGDNRLVYSEILRMSLYSRQYRGIAWCDIGRHLEDCRQSIEEARLIFSQSGNPNAMIQKTIECVHDSFVEAYSNLGPLDVKRTVDGISRSIIRNSRRRESFVLKDLHVWLGDLSDQTFRARINHLISLGLLRKTGTTRDTRYVYVDPFQEIRRVSGGTFPHLDEDELQLFYLGVGIIARP